MTELASESKLSAFKAYDIRGRVPDELDEDLARKIGCAYAAVIKPKSVVVGHDVRLSGQPLVRALTAGLTECGVDVLLLGLCGTEEVYFATSHLGVDGGIMVTASHNPKNYNGMKLVTRGSQPISGDSGLHEIEAHAARGASCPVEAGLGSIRPVDVRDAYIAHVLRQVDTQTLSPLKVVVNAGNGCAGPVIDALAAHLPFELVRLQHDPDGNFPHGVPNPLLPQNRQMTAAAVRDSRADLGVAWDGDFDRCFFFDETGAFIEGYYIVGLLATRILAGAPGSKIIHDPRLTWNTLDLLHQSGGVAVMSKTGHAFIKERMRIEDAIYGGEMSAHHYFRDFFYCDSGMIPWLLVTEAISAQGRLSKLVGDRVAAFPASGEINRRVLDPHGAIKRIRAHYATQGAAIDETDGLSCAFAQWRFNLRISNTEPVIRLNVESRADPELMRAKTAEVLGLLTDDADTGPNGS